MLGRFVEKKMEQLGYEYPFENIKELLASSTYVVANLEGPIPNNHVPTPSQGFTFSFKSSVAPILSNMHISALSLANNHGTDWGKDGWINTKKVLDGSGVDSFGYSQTTVDDVYEINIDGKVVTVFGINMIANKWDEERAIEVTKEIRDLHPDTYLIAFLHWGEEYTHEQNEHQIAFAHTLVENGVDAIIGAHPHVVEGIETYKDKPIFYSLGNFIFDQYFSQDVQDGYALKMKVAEGKIIFEIIPYVSVSSQPKLADDGNKKRILNLIANLSNSILSNQIKSGLVTTP